MSDACFLRIGVCALYAHWEGFVKRTTEAYITFVAGRRLRYSDLSANFVALGLRTQIIEAGQSRKPTLHSHLATMFMSGFVRAVRHKCDSC